MPVFCVTARNCPATRKRLIISAVSEDVAAEALLLANNIPSAHTPLAAQPDGVWRTQATTFDGVTFVVSVEPADPNSPIDLPVPPGGRQPSEFPRRTLREARHAEDLRSRN